MRHFFLDPYQMCQFKQWYSSEQIQNLLILQFAFFIVVDMTSICMWKIPADRACDKNTYSLTGEASAHSAAIILLQMFNYTWATVHHYLPMIKKTQQHRTVTAQNIKT